jgi:hypothetical protein
MPLYDYTCELNHRTEKLVQAGVETIPCPVCGLTAHKATVYAVQSVIASGKPRMRDSFKLYQEASHEIEHSCNKFESETNAKAPSLGLWEKAKSQAQKVTV